MAASNTNEITPLISISGIPTPIRDDRKGYQKQLAIYLILASTVFERIAFYSLAANFAPSLQFTGDEICSKTFIGAFIFSGISYISTLIFAVITDAKLGRARTIMTGYVLYLIGYILASIFVRDPPEPCSSDKSNQTNNMFHTGEIFQEQESTTWINIALIIIAIGAGAVKSNLAVFGAEQIQESRITSRYFDKYFVAVNIGILIATLVIPSVSYTTDENLHIAYIFACSMIFLAMVLFLLGYRFYIHIKPHDSVLINCIPVLKNAFQTWYQYRKDQPSSTNRKSTNLTRSNSTDTRPSLIRDDSTSADDRPRTFLDYAKAVHHGKYHDRIVNDVKSLRSAFIVFSLLIPYWLIYNQLYTTFPLQGKYMRGSDPEYVIFWMTLGDPVTVIIGIVILNLFVYKYLDARNRPLTMTVKFLIGMCLASVTMFIAGGIELFRQKDCTKLGGYSSFSIYYQLSQSICMGLSELFATVACFEFSYFAAPRSAQSLFMSLYFCTVGLSSFIGTGYISIFSASQLDLDFSCPSPKETYWEFYTYFFILAGIQLIFVIVFFFCQRKYQIVKLNPQQTTNRQFYTQFSTAATT